MKISPLNLISTPMPVLSSLDLQLRVGLSSEDPMVGRHPTEPYEVFLSVYAPEGILLERSHLGQVPPSRRRFFDISETTGRLVSSVDHLAVVHRIPSRLIAQGANLEDEIEFEKEPDYSFFRSVVEYSYREGGDGGVIFETTPNLNSAAPGARSSNTITFTCQTVLSDVLNTQIVIIHYSVNPAYSKIATYNYALHSQSGELVASGRVEIAPFSVKRLDLAQVIPQKVVSQNKDAKDGTSAFNFVGYSEDAAFPVLVVNTAPSLGAVSVEHTHPPQTYLMPWNSSYQREAKTSAQRSWQSILSLGSFKS
jgi:hypothetical protein